MKLKRGYILYNSFYRTFLKRQNIRTESRSEGVRLWKWRERFSPKGYSGILGCDETILYFVCDSGCTTAFVKLAELYI